MLISSENGYWGLDKNPLAQIAPWSLDKSCDRLSGTKPCIYGFENSKIMGGILLIGDSTAGALSEVVIQIAKMKNMNVAIWARGGCSFRGEINSFRVEESCLDHNKKVLKYIEIFKPQVIIISNHFSSDSEVKGMFETLKLILGKSKLIVVGQTPIFPDSKNFQQRNLVLSNRYNPPKSFPITAMEQTGIKINIQERKMASKMQIPFVDLFNIFCTEQKCTRFQNGEWTFFDTAHLNIYGANLVLYPLLVALN